MSAAALTAVLNAALPSAIVTKMLDAYTEVKRNLYLGHLRPNEVEGGRFAEAVFRLLQHRTTGTHTALGQQLNTESIIAALIQIPAASEKESVRIHIPRTLRVIYDIRNKRDAAHLADGIDANLQDAIFVTGCCDWIMAEIARLYLGTTPAKAHELIGELVEKKAPVVQEFGAALKTLKPSLGPSDRLLILLYHRGATGATREELTSWLKPSQRASVGPTLNRLEHEKDCVHRTKDRFFLTRLGTQEVEQRKLLTP